MIEKPRMQKITEVKEECKDIKTFFFDESLDVHPGQFIMVWIPGVGEKPFSLSYRNGFTVKKIGNFTKKHNQLEVGDKIGIRGPYGHGFTLQTERSLIIGGGIGVAPLRLLAANLDAQIFSILGFRTKSKIIFESEFRKLGKLKMTTDDGSYGQRGFPTDYLKNLDFGSFDGYYACGPESLMKEVHQLLDMQGEFSLERYMRCGLGICGSCSFGGQRVCRDGPVFSSKELEEIPDFGNFTYDKAGKKTSIS